MLAIILTSILLTLIQMGIGWLWYSKFLFGNLFIQYSNTDTTKITPAHMKKSLMMEAILTFVKSLLIYIITANIVLILPQYFFIITISIIILMMLTNFNDVIWGNKTIELVILNMSHQGTAMLVAFVIARMVIA